MAAWKRTQGPSAIGSRCGSPWPDSLKTLSPKSLSCREWILDDCHLVPQVVQLDRNHVEVNDPQALLLRTQALPDRLQARRMTWRVLEGILQEPKVTV